MMRFFLRAALAGSLFAQPRHGVRPERLVIRDAMVMVGSIPYSAQQLMEDVKALVAKARRSE